MNFFELRTKLKEGMTTSVMSYGFDFQVDVVDGDDQFDDDKRLSFKMDRITKHQNEYQFDKHEMLPWEIKNAIGAKERRETVARWLKAAGGSDKQAVNQKSLPDVPDWQKVKFKT